MVNTGASATIGTAAAALTSGVASSDTIRDRAASSASPTPSTKPTTRPTRAFPPVTAAVARIVGNAATTCAAIALGAGSRNGRHAADGHHELPQQQRDDPERHGRPHPAERAAAARSRDGGRSCRALAQRLADLGDGREELGRLAHVVDCLVAGGHRRHRVRPARPPRGRRPSTTSVIRPGRGDITTTRSDSTTASGIEWVTNSTAAPVSRAIRSSSACIRSRVISSSAPNGSSMSSSFGRVGQRPGDRHPLLHAPGELAGPVTRRTRRARPARAAPRRGRGARPSPTPCTCRGSSTFSATVRHSSRPACWKAMP